MHFYSTARRDDIISVVFLLLYLLREGKLLNVNLSDKSTCMLLRTLHFTMPIVTVIIMLIGSKTWFKIIIFFSCYISNSFYFFAYF